MSFIQYTRYSDIERFMAYYMTLETFVELMVKYNILEHKLLIFFYSNHNKKCHQNGPEMIYFGDISYDLFTYNIKNKLSTWKS